MKPDETPLYPEDVLSAQPEVREVSVRVHGPALILVLENEGPARYVGVYTAQELSTIQGMLLHDERARETWQAFHSVSTDLNQAELFQRRERETRWFDQLHPETAAERDPDRARKSKFAGTRRQD